MRIGRGTRMPLQGAVDVAPLLGAIAGCHCSVLWLSGRDAIAGCHCRVPLLCDGCGGRVTTNFGGVDVVALQGAMIGGVTANFGGVDVVPLQGAIVVCYGWGRVTRVDVVPLAEWT